MFEGLWSNQSVLTVKDFMKKNLYKIIILMMVVIALSYVLVWPFHVSGDCMEPAIHDGQLYFLSRGLRYLRQYRIGDIILFKYEDKIWISRIVAVENNTIELIENKIIVNGSVIQDEIHRNWADWQFGTYAIDESCKVPSNHVYVLSDNLSAHHDDSRVFGPISEKSILGIVW